MCDASGQGEHNSFGVTKDANFVSPPNNRVAKADAYCGSGYQGPDDVTATGITLQSQLTGESVDPVFHSNHPPVTSPHAIFPVIHGGYSPSPGGLNFSSIAEGESITNITPVFFTPAYASIDPVPVFDECLSGVCSCEFVIASRQTQLRPCRAAQFLFGPSALDSIPPSERDLLWGGLTKGFDIVDYECPATYFCDNYDSIMEDSTHAEMCDLLRKEIAEGKVSVVEDTPRCVHSLGAVRKANGSLRPITDCSRPEGSSINNYMSSTFHSFTYNSVQDAVDILSPGDYMSVIDISSAYRAVCISADHTEFQGLSWDFGQGTQLLQDHRLCFGLKCAPNIFDSLSRFIVAIANARGAPRVINYLDDFLVMAGDSASCLQARQVVTSSIELLGFDVAWKKVTDPNPITTYLGITIDSINMELSLPLEKVVKLQNLLHTVLDRGRTSKKELECLGGLVSYCSYVVRGGRTFSRRIFDLAASYSRASKNIPLSDAIIDDLNWWLSFCGVFNGRACIIRDTHPLPVYSDASFKGFAAWVGKDYLFGFWSTDNSPTGFGGGCSHLTEPPSVSLNKPNINVYELWPLVAALQRWGHFFKNSRLHFVTDNMQVLAMVNTGRSANRTCMTWLREMFWLCFIMNIDIFATYIRSADNVLADALSRVSYTGMVTKCFDLLAFNNMCCSSSTRAIDGPTDVTPAAVPGLLTGSYHQEISQDSTSML